MYCSKLYFNAFLFRKIAPHFTKLNYVLHWSETRVVSPLRTMFLTRGNCYGICDLQSFLSFSINLNIFIFKCLFRIFWWTLWNKPV